MNEDKKIAVMIATDTIGTGNEELGHNLMKSYIYSLTEVDLKPATIMFLNRGVYLTTTGSPVLELIKQLENVEDALFDYSMYLAEGIYGRH